MRTLILGAGYTGTRLSQLLTSNGWDVVGTRTDVAERSGKDFEGDLVQFKLGNNDIRDVIDRMEWDTGSAISLVFTAGPPRMDSLENSLGLLKDFLETLPRERLRNFVYLSSTSVYGDRNGDWVDETDELEPLSRSGTLKMKCERMLTDFLSPSIPVIHLRPGGIYGPGRNSADRYLSDDYELVGDGNKWTNRIHREDLSRICMLACELEETEILNAVDGNPVRLRELVEFLYEETGRDPGEINYISWDEAEAKYSEMKLGLLKPSKRVSSEKIRRKYDFKFEYPTVYDGLKELLTQQ